MACSALLRYVYIRYHGMYNLKNSKQTFPVTLQRNLGQIECRRSYSTEGGRSKNSDLEEKRKHFNELEENYRNILCIEKLTNNERTIHFLHAEAVEKGHFTYDDPFLNEKVLTRLRHFLKGKCCGKCCRHCTYEHSNVADEKKKALARFNSSYWVYDEQEEDIVEFDNHDVTTYGRGPYPRKYAENAPINMIKIKSKPK